MITNVLSYLEASALTHPGRTAVVEENRRFTYSELEELSRRAGSALTAMDAAARPVGVYMEKGIDALAAFFGALYAGGFYSFYNPELPKARLRQIHAVLKPAVVITNESMKPSAEALFPGCAIVTAEALSIHPVDEAALERVRERSIDVDPVYVNFTSGSTGVPKGIVVSHRSILDFIDCFSEHFGIREDDVIANQAPFDFDVSVKDIYTAMKAGATLLIVPRAMFSTPALLVDYLCEHGATVLIWAVSALCLLSAFHALDYRVPDKLRQVMFSGEVMPMKHLRQWQSRLPGTTFVNLYGPTEITCNCTYHVLEPGRDYAGGIPIGRPFPNEGVFLLDGSDHLVTEPGVIGEICVRGTALALGYYAAPEETRKRFTPNPLRPDYDDRIYRTGDLGKYDEAGDLFFCGRKDFQIKYMGHRVELEEIERAMSDIEGVTRCCCTFDAQKSRLKGYYVGDIGEAALRKRLMEFLPVFMVPGRITRLNEMPLNKNGKIDRKALDAPEGGRP